MSPETFAQLCDLVPDGLILVDAGGAICGANATALTRLNIDPKAASGPLEALTWTPQGELASFLRLCRRSSEEVIGVLTTQQDAERVRVFGRVLNPPHKDEPVRVLLRIPQDDSNFGRFTMLTEKINELGREISRRRAAEASLRGETQLARFGNEIGRALVQETDLSTMLTRCTDLIVEYLDAAFARIWLMEPNGHTLKLWASSGMYTHIDGDHARIEVGQFKIGMIAESQTAHVTNSVVGDPQVHDQQWAKREGMVAFLGHPMIVDGATIGVIAMFADHEVNDNTSRSLASIANNVGLGVTRKRVELELRKKQRALTTANKRKDEFLAMLGHELRNPLAPVQSGLELMRLEHGANESLMLMEQEVSHLARLVDDLLDLSRITRGRIELRPEPTPMKLLVDQAVHLAAPLIEQRKHSLTVAPCPDTAWVDVDPVRIVQVLSNLLNNAAKYTDPGGTLTIETSADDEWVEVIVEDDGQGIEPELLPDVFDLFTQAERGLARAEGGLGIGLTLAKRLVEQHGGSISASSSGPGQGSKFSVRFKRVPAPQQQAQPSVTKAPPTVNTDLRILLVDDNPASSTMLARLLKALGVEHVAMAEDGKEALRKVAEFRPDVIFLDLGLPGMDGYEVAATLRSDAALDDLQIIALTGYGSLDDKRRSRRAGFNAHLVKPIKIEQIIELLPAASEQAG